MEGGLGQFLLLVTGLFLPSSGEVVSQKLGLFQEQCIRGLNWLLDCGVMKMFIASVYVAFLQNAPNLPPRFEMM